MEIDSSVNNNSSMIDSTCYSTSSTGELILFIDRKYERYDIFINM